jgi:lipoate-protein ligase A
MSKTPLHIVANQSTGSASLDTAVSRAVLQRVSESELPETLEIARPHRIVAFGKHDTLTNGFHDAVDIAIEHSFDPTIRIAGGRAVVFHPQTVRFAWTLPVADPVTNMHDRFRTVAARVVATLDSFDVDAAMGELEREYCPGTYSVYVEGTGKVMGSGQRLAKHAAQIAGMIVVRDAATVNKVLVPIYAALGLDMDPAVTGAVADVVDVDAEVFAERYVERFTMGRESIRTEVDDATMALAHKLQPAHDPRVVC